MTAQVVHPGISPLHWPTPLSLSVGLPPTAKIENQDRVFRSSTFNLDATLSHCGQIAGSDAVLFVHGFGSGKNGEVAELLAYDAVASGIYGAALRFNLRQHGDAVTDLRQFTLSGGVTDLKAAYGLLKDEGAKNITVASSSFGTQIALDAALEGLPITKIVGWSSVTDYMGGMLQHLGPANIAAYLRDGFPLEKDRRVFVSPELIAELTDRAKRLDYSRLPAGMAVDLIHGQKDEQAPLPLLSASSASIPNRTMSVIPNGSHGLSTPRERAALVYWAQHRLFSFI